MLPHNPFFPKHTMCFKSSGGLSVGGVSLAPKSLGYKDVWNSGANPGVSTQQYKNWVTGKGFTTDAKAKANADAADQANMAIQAQAVGSMNPGNQESLQAEQDLRRQALRNMGFLKTTYAGETGGFGAKKSAGAGA